MLCSVPNSDGAGVRDSVRPASDTTPYSDAHQDRAGRSRSARWCISRTTRRTCSRRTPTRARARTARAGLRCRCVRWAVGRSDGRWWFADCRGARRMQGLGGLLIRKVDGDFQNVVGFPAASFFRFLDLLVEEDDEFLEV